MRTKLFIPLFMCLLTYGTWAQDNITSQQDNDKKTWYHKSYEKTKVYGIGTQEAYQFLESKGLSPQKVTVGVLDSGVQIDHPGLSPNIWTNSKEIPNNGIDDDKNGYVDDVHGWNFLGNNKGDVDEDTMEVTRVVKKYQSVFESADSLQNKIQREKMPEEYEMYKKSKEIFDEKKQKAKNNYITFFRLKNLIPKAVSLLQNKNLTPETLIAVKIGNVKDAVSLNLLQSVLENEEMKGKSPEEVKKYLEKEVEEPYRHYKTQYTQQYNLDFDPRKELVGDNENDYGEKIYGNNHYEGPDALHGTHVAGIIAGVPNKEEKDQYGVAYKVAKIMSVRTVPNGDERDKDVANAIRYAVDNGAKVINMSFGKPVSPGKKHVWEALRYAEKNNVLLVKAAGNENENLDKNAYYPINFLSLEDKKPFVSNVIIVGASTDTSDSLKASFSNYSDIKVDVFAPGQEIYSTVPKNQYKYLQGTSMASPIVAGAATVLLAYMPTLTPAEIIESLVMTVNKPGVKTAEKEGKLSFSQLSRSGGIIDLKKAAEYAYTHFYSKTKKISPQKIRSKRTRRGRVTKN
ncbi:MAG: peptidase S8 [Bergeyella sp.]|nr:peptidase S8 [Bergeyella sp.]